MATCVGGSEVCGAVIEQVVVDVREALQTIAKLLDRMNDRPDRIDDRITKHDSNRRTRSRWLLGSMLAGFAGLLGAMAHGFHWL